MMIMRAMEAMAVMNLEDLMMRARTRTWKNLNRDSRGIL